MTPVAGHHGKGADEAAAKAAPKEWAETQPFLPKPAQDLPSPKHRPQGRQPPAEPAHAPLDTRAPGRFVAKAGAAVGGHALLTGVGATVVAVLLVMVGVTTLGLNPGDGDPNVETADLDPRRTGADRQGDRPIVDGSSATIPPDAESTTVPETTTTTRRTTTTRPPSVVITSPPPTDAPPSSSPPPTEAPAPAPEIVRFTAHRGGSCSDHRTLYDVSLFWTVDEATSGTIAPEGGSATPVDLSTSRTNVCAERGSTWILTVTGPGGTTTDSTTVPY